MGHELREQVASSLTAGIELLLHAPYYTYDFFHSTNWNVSLLDMAVNLDSNRRFDAFWMKTCEIRELQVLRGVPGSGHLQGLYRFQVLEHDHYHRIKVKSI